MNSEWKTTVATPGAGSASLASSQSTASAFSTATGIALGDVERALEKLEAPGLVRPHERHQREPVLGGARIERRGVAAATLGDRGGDLERRTAGGIGALEADRRARVAPCLVALDVVILGPAKQQTRRSTPAPAGAGGAPSPAPPAGSRSGARSSGRPRSSARGGRAARGCGRGAPRPSRRTRATGRPSRFLPPRDRSGPARAPRPRAPACAWRPSAAPRAGRTGRRPTAGRSASSRQHGPCASTSSATRSSSVP